MPYTTPNVSQAHRTVPLDVNTPAWMPSATGVTLAANGAGS
jgi:hypothetical protein